MVAISPSLLRATGIALAIAAGVVLSPARATAGCGDYVHVAGPTGEAAPAPANHDRDDLPRPCHGPGCSNRPSQPAPPLTAPVTDSAGAKELAARSAAVDDPADGAAHNRAPRSIGSPVHVPSAILDPPRAG
jgi:hypothetical protein